MLKKLVTKVIKIPKGVKFEKDMYNLIITGRKGKKTIPFKVGVLITDKCVYVVNKLLLFFEREHYAQNPRALQGTTIALIKQAIIGVQFGFRIKLRVVGVGYKVSLKKNLGLGDGFYLSLKLGYSHMVFIRVPAYIDVSVPTTNIISLFGSDKREVNSFAAVIRSYKIPEPYKGKGILYINETVTLKEGKRS